MRHQIKTSKLEAFPRRLYTRRGMIPAVAEVLDVSFPSQLQPVLFEAVHKFSFAIDCRRFFRSGFRGLPSGVRGGRLSWTVDLVQDFIYEKSGTLLPSAVIRAFLVGIITRSHGDVCPPRSRFGSPSSLPQESSRITYDERTVRASSGLLLKYSDTTIKSRSLPTVADDSGFVDCFDQYETCTGSEGPKDESSVASLISLFADKATTSDPFDFVSSSPPRISSSMSRRRLVSNIPVLHGKVKLPPLPSADDLGAYQKRNFRPSPQALTLSPAALAAPLVRSKALPITPMDQVMSKPVAPPPVHRRSVKRVSAFEHEFSQCSGFLSSPLPPLSSPCLVQAPAGFLSISQAALFPTAPITPLDQIMPAPSNPPKLTHRSPNQAHASYNDFADDRQPPSSRDPLLTPSLAPEVVTGWPSLEPISNEREREAVSNYHRKGDETPRPLAPSSQLRTTSLKIRPSRLFSMHERGVLESRALSARSPVALSLAPQSGSVNISLGKLPLASPFSTGGSTDGAFVHAYTPLVGPYERLSRGDARAGTPSYFSARSYFVNH